jgi:hypothetical protein
MVSRIPLETVLLGSRRTSLHRTKALSSSESTVAIRYSNACSTIRAFSGQSSAPGAEWRFFRLARLVETLGCQGMDAESQRASEGSVHANIDLPRPQAFGRHLVRAPNAKSNGDKLPALGTQELPQSLEPQNLNNSEILCWQRVPFRLSRTYRLRP